MTKDITRRTLFAAAAAAASSAALPALAADQKKPNPPAPDFPHLEGYPRVRAGTELKKIYEGLLAKGFAIRKPGLPEGLPVAVMAMDTQCPWCSKLLNASMPLSDRIDFRWYPTAVLRTLSLTQGAYILSSPDPWAKFMEHEEHFRDEGHRGLRTEEMKIDNKFHDQIWTNSKLLRRAGGTVVPLGVFKTADGRYVPILSGTSTEELKAILGLA